MRASTRLIAILLASALAACSREAPVSPEFAITEQDRVVGAQQHPGLLNEFGGAYAGDEAPYVRQVGERIADAAGLGGQCTFTLVNSAVVNAFAVPGCYIYVTRGLVAVVTSEAELASVLGHEVGHIVARHAQRQENRSIWRQLGVIAVSVTGSERLTRLAGQAAQYFGLRYSRTQEYEADDLGVEYLQRAGYDVFAASDMLDALQRQEAFMAANRADDAARSVPEWALSHPLTERRIDRARETAEKTGLADDQLPEREAPYLAAVDGMLYGDDPEQGFVIGQWFGHPIMRISFEAPPGFTLMNSPRAIGLNGPDGISGEFGGHPLRPGGLERHARALAEHVVGDAPGEIAQFQRTIVNGLPTIIMQVRVAVQNGAVPLAIAVYDGGDGQAYHFIIASPPADAAAGAISQLFSSFRRLSPAEAARLRPRVIRTIRVQPGESGASLAARMADPAPQALFTLLNGGDAERQAQPGQMVKIVTFTNAMR